MIFNWHLFYNYAKHPKMLVMMKMMMHHHHAHQQESMLQTDFVVASNLIFWKNCFQQQKSENHRGSASCALKKADVEILIVFAKNAKLHYAKCHAMLNTILRKDCDCAFFENKILSQKSLFVSFQT